MLFRFRTASILHPTSTTPVPSTFTRSQCLAKRKQDLSYRALNSISVSCGLSSSERLGDLIIVVAGSPGHFHLASLGAEPGVRPSTNRFRRRHSLASQNSARLPCYPEGTRKECSTHAVCWKIEAWKNALPCTMIAIYAITCIARDSLQWEVDHGVLSGVWRSTNGNR
jgi:hypothetical protein